MLLTSHTIITQPYKIRLCLVMSMKTYLKKSNHLHADTYSGKTAARDKLLGTIILIIAALLFIWLSVIIFRPIMKLVSDPEKMRSFIHSQGVFGRTAFIGIQILQGFLPIPLELTTVAAGYIFGKVEGCVITICSTIISTTIIFYSTKIFGRKVVDLFFSPERQRKIKYIRDEKVRNTIILIVFLIPGAPKRLFVFTAALTPQRFGKFLIISTLARIPSLLACSFGGSALCSGNYGKATVIFILIGIISAFGLLFYKLISASRSKNSKN